MNRKILIALLLCSCASLTPEKMRTDANFIAKTVQTDAPFVPNPVLAAGLYGLGAVLAAYGNSPVPVKILKASAPGIPGIESTVAPLLAAKTPGDAAATVNQAAALLAAK